MRILTHIDADDWHWYYIGQELVYEGHSSLNDAGEYIINALVGKDNWEEQETEVGDIPTDHEYLAEAASHRTPNLIDWVNKFGAAEVDYFDWTVGIGSEG